MSELESKMAEAEKRRRILAAERMARRYMRRDGVDDRTAIKRVQQSADYEDIRDELADLFKIGG